MARPHLIFAILLLCVLPVTVGCGQSDDAEIAAENSGDSLLGDLLKDIDLTEGPPAGEESSLESDTTSVSRQTEPRPNVFAASAKQESTLLQLAAGDHFRFVKTVEQKLIQKSDQQPATAQTKLDLYIELTVAEQLADAVRFDVQYRRVSYSQDINGQIASYDSALQIGPVPPAFAPYAGMVDNQFSFELGLDNTLRSVQGIESFLQRCVAQVPAADRDRVLMALRQKFDPAAGPQLIAELLDDSIGLLPYRSPSGAATIEVGDEWLKQQKLVDPAPINVQTTCRLLSLTPSTAEISISESFEPDPAAVGGPIEVKKGRSSGACLIDRITGMPVEASRSQYLSMVVQTADGSSLQQEKQVKTTLVAQSSGPVVHNSLVPSNIQPVNAQLPAQSLTNSAPPRNTAQLPGSGVVPAGGNRAAVPLSSTATAVYPD